METKILIVLLLFALRSQGLKLSLEKSFSQVHSVRETCGVLQCVESIQSDINTKRDTQTAINASDIPASISSLSIFKLEVTSASGDEKDERHIRLGSITPQKPLLTTVANGIKIDGNLEPEKAKLRVEMKKEVDCSAEFFCESRGIDVEGKNFVRTSHVKQHVKRGSDQKNDFNWAPTQTLFVVSLIQQLDTKISVLQSALSHDVQSVRSDLDTKVDRLEDKIVSLGKYVGGQTTHLEDKVENLQNYLIRIFDVYTDQSRQTAPSTKYNRFDTNSVKANMTLIKDKFGDMLRDLNSSFNNVDKQNKAWQSQIQQYFSISSNTSNSTECDEKKNISDLISRAMGLFKSNIDKKIDQIASKLDAVSLQPKLLLDAKFSDENITVGGELRSVMTELMKPKNCYKGMASHTSLVASQYSVIKPNSENKLAGAVLCDTFTDGGGWIVFQRRFSGDVNFYKSWKDYKRGFGSLGGEFWLGNDYIHLLTNSGIYELRVDLRYNGRSVFAHYDSFSVAGEHANYALSVGHYTGTAGDSLITNHNGMPFSTHDRDNDALAENCAIRYVGAWWYNKCHDANLNGQWKAGNGKGPMWRPLTGDNGISFSEMKIRRVF